MMENMSSIINKIDTLKRLAMEMDGLEDNDFAAFANSWNELVEHVKLLAYDQRNKFSLFDFEYGWGACSVQYIIDCLPEFHRVLRTYYKRDDVLKLIDVGAGSCAGTNILIQLHSSNYIWSRIDVEAIDYTPLRKRWTQIMYPRIKYSVGNLFELPSRAWDIVFCSAVIEHVENPRRFVEHLARICNGFAFIYAPYKEVNRIRSHLNTLDKSLFHGMKVYSTHIIKSMAWHPGRPKDSMFLTVIDCRTIPRQTTKVRNLLLHKIRRIIGWIIRR